VDPKLLKLIVKQGLKLASPLFGSFVTDLGSEVAGLVIDARMAKSGDDVLARLSTQIEKELDTILGAEREGVATAPIMATVESMIGDESSLRSAWQEAGFDAEAASRVVIRNNGALLRGLSEEEVSLSRRLIEALFTAAGNERKMLDATEAHFRRTVLAKLDILAAQGSCHRSRTA